METTDIQIPRTLMADTRKTFYTERQNKREWTILISRCSVLVPALDSSRSKQIVP